MLAVIGFEFVRDLLGRDLGETSIRFHLEGDLRTTGCSLLNQSRLCRIRDWRCCSGRRSASNERHNIRERTRRLESQRYSGGDSSPGSTGFVESSERWISSATRCVSGAHHIFAAPAVWTQRRIHGKGAWIFGTAGIGRRLDSVGSWGWG